MSFPLIVSFYTEGTPYEQEAERLTASCERFDLETHIAALPSTGRWRHNCCLKGPFIADCLRRFSRPILWLDADAELVKFPALFEDADFEFGAYRGRRLLSGTLYFAQTDAAQRLADDWSQLCVRRPSSFDQTLLQRALDRPDRQIVFRKLPQSYCKILDFPWRERDREPVIVHHQASRRLKSMIGSVEYPNRSKSD